MTRALLLPLVLVGLGVWVLRQSQAPTRPQTSPGQGGALPVSKPETVPAFSPALDWLNFDLQTILYPFGKPAPKEAETVTEKPYQTGGNAMMPRGIANNNPLNIRENAQTDYDWQGEAADDRDPSFEEFDTPWYGIRAAARTLKTYRDRHGLNSIRGIIQRWAPPSDNNPTAKYIDFVSRQAGVSADQPLGAADYPRVVAAMIHFENGFNPYDENLIAGAVAAGLN